jgi:cytosine/adenosine deaminase-related metal-dependent hydrolase
MTTLATARALLAPEDALAARDMAITLQGGRIAAVAPAQGAVADTLVLPAPIDAHDHGRGLRPIAFGGIDLPLEIWSAGFAAQPRVDAALVAQAAFARLAAGGSAGTVHLHRPLDYARILDEAKLVAAAAQAIGIRLAFVVPMVDRNALAYAADEEVLAGYDPAERETVQRLLARPKPSVAEQIALAEAITAAIAGPLADVQLGPGGPQWVSDALMEAIADHSARTGQRVHMHLFETRRQREWADAAHGAAPMAHYDRLGLLSPRLTVAHGVWLTPREIALFAERGVTVATNTSSNLRLRSGLAPLAAWRRAGLRFAVGLDGLTFDDDDDMLREIRLAHLLNLGTDLEPALTPADMLAAACREGRRVLDGTADAGRIAPGADADLLVLDRARLAADAVAYDGDDLALLMARGTAAHITGLIVAGREVIRQGRLTGIDLVAVHRELAAQTRAAAPERAAHHPFIGRHRTRLRAFYGAGGHLRRGRG